MRKLFVALLLVYGAAFLAMPALAQETNGNGEIPKMMNANMAMEMKSRAARLGSSTHANDTTWVGYNPAYAGSNYWSIGPGHRWPRGTFGPTKGDIVPVPNDDTGYWDWDHPVHGDSLQGWWPMRHLYTGFYIASLTDMSRPWHAIDIGNSISYVINQGPGLRRTYGVTSAWHSDRGSASVVPDPGHSDVNPLAPAWTAIAGSRSAWCGIRAHGDVSEVDAVTGNPYNADALDQVQAASTAAGWTNYRFPGYADQWDQMLYRDVDISNTTDYPNGTDVSVSFSYRTRMSVIAGVNPTSRTGWFDKDPLTMAAGNFISSTNTANPSGAPIDSFMVYVGNPVGDNVGDSWTGSDGGTHPVFDPVRRWFGELIRANEVNGHYQLLSTYGDDPPIAVPNGFNAVTATRAVTYGTLRSAWGNKIRLVFRVKTNRGANGETQSSDGTASIASSYNSGYLGAAQIDAVSINGSGSTSLGGFENASDIDNHSNVTALNAWKTSSKPPAIIHHKDDLTTLLYQDLCGPPGSIARICDMAGNVISMGDHELGEAFNGPSGTTEQEQFHGISSPTVNLAVSGTEDVPGPPNNMGLDGDTANPTALIGVAFNIYTGGFDLRALGSGYQAYAKSYPATQSDGTRTWGTMRFAPFQNFNVDKQCYDQLHTFTDNTQIRTTNASGIPDSIQVGLRKIGQCWRFGVTTLCGTTLGGYWDNVSLCLLDGAAQPISVAIWELWNDTFPANESAGLPGLSAFDTTSALIKSGLNTAPLTTDLTRYDVPGDTLQVLATGDSTEVQLKFRIWPGPGNYKIPGDVCSGLRRVPSDTTRISPADDSFWTEYILNPGKDKGSFPTTGPCKGGGLLRHDQRWNELVWCNARMDTAEQNLFPVARRAIGIPQAVGTYATMYHDDDKHLAALGIVRHKCFLVDTLAAANNTNITCNSVPAWVTAAPGTGYNGVPTTVEGTKILPDGLFTPGTHVEYFFLAKQQDTGLTAMCPDTNLVWPQNGEANFDAHRWQQFSVLPDAWKFSSYGGLGKACMLYVDWEDRQGGERVWVSVADSIGATGAARKGAHNGWIAPSKVDINDPAYFVNKNCQPGTTWDMYGVKAAESLNSNTGTLGARLAYRVPGTFMDDKWAKNAPTPEMLDAYYRILMILTGGLNTGGSLIGPIDDRSQDDQEVIRLWTIGATTGNHRGLFLQGDAAMEDMDATGNLAVADLLSSRLRDASYLRFSGNTKSCIDLIPTSVITTNGDIYGIRNTCLQTLDVLAPQGAGVAASFYDPVNANVLNAPYVASVFTDDQEPGGPNYWQGLLDGFDIFNLRSRLCDKTYGRLAYFWNVYTNIFGKICSVAGTGPQTVEVPNNNNGSAFVDFAGIGNNPLRQGSAVINLTLAKADRVTVKIYDVSGRLVRTLADGQMFKAGKADPTLMWDGLDNGGRQVARGAYFVSVKYANSRYDASRKMIVLK